MASGRITSTTNFSDSDNVCIKTGNSTAGGEETGAVSVITGNTPFQTKDFVDADVDVGANTIAIADHGMQTGAKSQFTTDGTLPGGLSLLTDYYVIVVSSSVIKVAASLADAQNNVPVDITSAAGGGTHNIRTISANTGLVIIQTGDVGSDDGQAGSIYLVTGSAASGKEGAIQLNAGTIALSPTIAITCNNKPIQSVGTPSSADEAANKGYVDTRALNYQLSTSCGTFTRNNVAAGDITNLTITITSIGRPVMIEVVPDGTTSAAFVGIHSAVAAGDATISCLRGSDLVGKHRLIYSLTAISNEVDLLVGSIRFFDPTTITPGTYVYKLQALTDATTTFEIRNAKLLVYEM